jgi:HEAT repeat protein
LNVSSAPGEEKGPVSWGVLLFLHQVKNGSCQVVDMDVLAPDRTYDLGGERLVWLGSATEGQGLELLRALSGREAASDLHKELVFALYLFNGPAAVSELIALARRDASSEIRKQAIFWLGQKASAAAVNALGDVIASPEALEIKKAAVFALSQLPEDRGTPLLLKIARDNPQPRLRKEAIFWLGESGDPRALEFFEEVLLK